MLLQGRRRPWLLGGVACAGGLVFAYVLQYGFHLEPCPLCILQRIAMLAAGLGFLLIAAVGPQGVGRWLAQLAILPGCVAGIAIAGRHVWLQSLPPDQVPACGPPLDQLLAVLPLTEAMAFVLRGEGSCAVIDAAFLGLSLPAWTLIAFVLIGLWSLLSVGFSKPNVG